MNTFQRGFTLIELMIVVAIVAILASVALPSYQEHIRRTKVQEATSSLSAERVAMEQYFQDNRTYVGATLKSAATKYWNYALSNHTATTYTITATPSGSDMSGYQYTIDQNNARTSIAGGTVGATCWLDKKGGSC
ncbi:MAG: type IV pilin protein [Pseudomonadota bacterium]